MKIITEKYNRDFLIDQGAGFRTVRWSAHREFHPNVKGYGKKEKGAIDDLVRNVQPLSDAETERGFIFPARDAVSAKYEYKY